MKLAIAYPHLLTLISAEKKEWLAIPKDEEKLKMFEEVRFSRFSCFLSESN